MGPILALRLAAKVMNDTMVPDGLVPTLLVYGTLTRLPTSNYIYPDQEARMRAFFLARREYETIVASRSIAMGLRA